MKKAVLIFLMMLLSKNISFGKDIIQVTSEDNPRYLISVTHGGEFIGEIKVEMFPEVAPKHVHNFDSLVSIQFYDRTAFHRVIPNFMIQGGDPNSKDKSEDTWGYGDPSQIKVPAEFSSLNHLRGILSAARAQDINSATSQFFICVADAPHLDGNYSIYGEVFDGMDVADLIVNVPRNPTNNMPFLKVEMMITKIEETDYTETIQLGNDIVICPNPVKDIIGFKSSNDNLMLKSIELSDISGRTILNREYATGLYIEQIQIPVNNLSNGIYFIRLTDSDIQIYTLKIVVN
ncbi:MAG: peptidylprolyl isomerase [bacterium]